MFKRIALIGSLTLLLGVLAVPAAHAQPRFSIQVGIGGGAPYPGCVWQPGQYIRTGYGYEWVSGAWVPGEYGRVVTPRWDRERSDWGGYPYYNYNYGYNYNRNYGRDRDYDRDRGRDGDRGRDRGRDDDRQWRR